MNRGILAAYSLACCAVIVLSMGAHHSVLWNRRRSLTPGVRASLCISTAVHLRTRKGS